MTKSATATPGVSDCAVSTVKMEGSGWSVCAGGERATCCVREVQATAPSLLPGTADALQTSCSQVVRLPPAATSCYRPSTPAALLASCTLRPAPLTEADCVDGAEAREVILVGRVVAVPRDDVEGGKGLQLCVAVCDCACESVLLWPNSGHNAECTCTWNLQGSSGHATQLPRVTCVAAKSSPSNLCITV